MTNSKHTPGPWFAHNIGLGPKSHGPYTFPLGTDPDEAAANARLIAAAPEMLKLLAHVPHNRKKRLHEMVGRVAGCPGCDAQAILSEMDGGE